jgi:hypothetical protein
LEAHLPLVGIVTGQGEGMDEDNALLMTFHPFLEDMMHVELRWNIVTSIIRHSAPFGGGKEGRRRRTNPVLITIHRNIVCFTQSTRLDDIPDRTEIHKNPK